MNATTDTTTDSPKDHARDNATAWYESIEEMVAALEDPEQDDDGNDIPNTIDGNEVTPDEAREHIEQSVLSVEVRSDWHTPGDTEESAPSEYRILLTTGGPALRIIGDLDQYGQPDSARLQYQDWGTPWTELLEDVDHDILIQFASVFYFGEGC